MWDPEEIRDFQKKEKSIDDKYLNWKEKRVWDHLVFKQRVGLIQELRILKSNKFFAYKDQVGELVFARLNPKNNPKWTAFKHEWKLAGPAKLELYKDFPGGVFLVDRIVPDRIKGEIDAQSGSE